MQGLSKTLSLLLGVSLLALGWAVFEIVKAKSDTNLAMQQAELANQRIDSLVEKMYSEGSESATS